MIADTKKVQTMINRTAWAMQKVREGVAEIEAAKDLFQTANPDVTGTPLDGNVAAIFSVAINAAGIYTGPR